jgi:hypothetical protein
MKRTGKLLVALLAVVILLTSMSALTASAATGQPEKVSGNQPGNFNSAAE